MAGLVIGARMPGQCWSCGEKYMGAELSLVSDQGHLDLFVCNPCLARALSVGSTFNFSSTLEQWTYQSDQAAKWRAHRKAEKDMERQALRAGKND